MSISEMNRVWENSVQKKTALLALLAIADMSNKEGISWPCQETIAERARTTRRSVVTLVRNCVKADELAYIAVKGKPHKYCILVGLSTDEREARIKAFREVYPKGKLFTCEEIAHVKKPQQVGVEKISHLPAPKQAQKCAGSVIEPSIDPSNKDSGEQKRDPWFDAICLVCGMDTTKAPGGQIVKVKKQLIKKWTPEDVEAYHRWRESKRMGVLGSHWWLDAEMSKLEWRNGHKSSNPDVSQEDTRSKEWVRKHLAEQKARGE